MSKRAAPSLAIALVCILAAGIYLLFSALASGPGFPLDDAWIHQTYARNLARWGQWSYLKDQPSAGSTAPLWSALLALGYALGMDRYFWAYGLGVASLFATAQAGEVLARRLLPDQSVLKEGDSGVQSTHSYPSVTAGSRVPWVGLFLAGEWHLVWAAVSGMETVAYAAMVLVVLGLVSKVNGRGWGVVGLLIGLGVWIRPDALTLWGPALLVLILGDTHWKQRGLSLCWLVGGFMLFFGPYLLFNLQVQGSLWPNTFYAKQAEYAELRQASLAARYWEQLRLPLVGAGLFLLPGFVAFGWNAMRRRQWAGLGAAIWFLGFAAIYAERLPVTYQYGRYLIPAMPVYFVLGLAGLRGLLAKPNLILRSGGEPLQKKPARFQWKTVRWALERAWIFSLVGVWLAFYGIVAGFYARDVAIIETEMVATARWLATHTPPDALLAVHDIGAVGYFSERRILDLAGLVSPDIIPIIRDEKALAERLDAMEVDYLVTLKGWYAHLPDGKEPVFQSGGKVILEAGGENMWVYRWR